MAIDFPNSPTNGQTFTVGTKTWTYSSAENQWLLSSVSPDSGTLTTKGDLLTRSSSALVRLPVGSNGDLLVADSGATEGLRWQGQEVAGRNKIINGNMMVAQRGTSFTSTGSANNDDAYTLDRWYILSDGNDTIDVTQSTDAPTGGLNSIALDVETINRKFGIAQIIEQKNCIGLIGETVTLSFRARVSSTTKLDNVKAAIVAWSGTADTVTSDIISAWGVEGTNPTLIANATFENTPANLGVTTSWARYSITAAVDTASTKNIIVFIWSDVTDTTLGDFLYVTDVQLEYGSVPTRFTMHAGGIENEISACRRYYEKSYTLGTAPGTATSDGLVENSNSTFSDSKVYYTVRFSVLKRYASWTGTSYTSGGTSGSWSYYRNGASGTAAMTFGTPADTGFVANVNAGAAWVVALIGGHWVVDAEM